MVAFRSGATEPATKDLIFSDLNIKFQAHPVNKKIGILKNEDAIKRAIRNLILTNKYEKFYNPLFGGNVRAYLFENFTPSLRANLTLRIEETIQSFEPRAKVLEVKVIPNEDQNALDVYIVFQPINSIAPVQLNLTLERIR